MPHSPCSGCCNSRSRGAWRSVEQSRRAKEDALRQAIGASERERRPIAADLHDGVVQDLIGLSYRLAGAAQQRSPKTPTLVGALDTGAADARSAVKRARTALVEINPQNLQALGLRGAVDDLVSPLTIAGVSVRVDVEGNVDDLPTETQTVLFGAVREAVRNVAEHAHATTLDVLVRGDADQVRAVILDNGSGFDAARRQASEDGGHLGLVLHERLVDHLGGTFLIESSVGLGTTVSVELPTRVKENA